MGRQSKKTLSLKLRADHYHELLGLVATLERSQNRSEAQQGERLKRALLDARPDAEHSPLCGAEWRSTCNCRVGLSDLKRVR